MGIRVCENLKLLASEFTKSNANLYIVGGYVRNSLLGIGNTDIDITGALSIEDVIKLSNHLGFRAQVVNKNLGTVLITTNKEQFEYTRFRAESYSDGGNHVPVDVKFVDDIKVDAARRDFTVNALYFDITNNKVLDFFNGLSDLDKKILRTCKEPDVTFKDDGVRILRLVRFVCELGFKPEPKTLQAAIKEASNVKGISRERVLKEVRLTINGPLKYKQKSLEHKNVVKYYNKLNVWQYIFNSNFANFKISTLNKMYNVFVKSDGDYRYLAFVCMVLNNYLKGKTTDANLVSLINTLFGSTGLKESNKNMQDMLDAYRFVQRLLYDKPKTYTDNRSCLAFDALSFEIKSLLVLVNTNKVNEIKMNILNMKKSRVPFDVDELKITNDELINKLHIKNQNISVIKQKLFEMCVDGVIVNDHTILVEQAKHLNEILEKNVKNKKDAK